MELSGGPFSVVFHFFDKAFSGRLPQGPHNLPELGPMHCKQLQFKRRRKIAVCPSLSSRQESSQQSDHSGARPAGEPACTKLAGVPACTKPAGESACSTVPAVPEECPSAQEPHVARCVVHRICLSVPPCFSCTARHSLLSWSYGYRQFLWTYGGAAGVQWPPGCEVRDAALLLPEAEYKELMGRGAAIDYIHKLLVARALLECGGVYVALDVLWLGRQLPFCSGRYRQMWIAPRDSDLLQGAHAQAWAAGCWSVARVGIAADWTSLLQTLECYFYSLAFNATRASQVRFVSKVHPLDVALPDMMCCPLAKSVVLPMAFEELQQASIAVTIWEDKWPISVVEAVLTWATSCLSSRHATNPTAFPMRDSEAQYLFRMGIVSKLQELFPTLVQLCDDMHAAYRIMADAIAYAQTKGALGVTVLGRLHQPSPRPPSHADGNGPTVDELTAALLIVVIPTYISHPPIASWRDVLMQQAKVGKAAVDPLVPIVRAKILSTACMVPPEESADKQWGIPIAQANATGAT